MEKTVQISQVIRPISEQVADIARSINEAKAKIKYYTEELDNMCDSDKAYREASKEYSSASLAKKVAKNKIMAGEHAVRLLTERGDIKVELKELNEKMSATLEVHLSRNGGVPKIDIFGTEVAINKKFTIKPSQLKLFE